MWRIGREWEKENVNPNVNCEIAVCVELIHFSFLSCRLLPPLQPPNPVYHHIPPPKPLFNDYSLTIFYIYLPTLYTHTLPTHPIYKSIISRI